MQPFLLCNNLLINPLLCRGTTAALVYSKKLQCYNNFGSPTELRAKELVHMNMNSLSHIK